MGKKCLMILVYLVISDLTSAQQIIFEEKETVDANLDGKASVAFSSSTKDWIIESPKMLWIFKKRSLHTGPENTYLKYCWIFQLTKNVLLLYLGKEALSNDRLQRKISNPING